MDPVEWPLRRSLLIHRVQMPIDAVPVIEVRISKQREAMMSNFFGFLNDLLGPPGKTFPDQRKNRFHHFRREKKLAGYGRSSCYLFSSKIDPRTTERSIGPLSHRLAGAIQDLIPWHSRQAIPKHFPFFDFHAVVPIFSCCTAGVYLGSEDLRITGTGAGAHSLHQSLSWSSSRSLSL